MMLKYIFAFSIFVDVTSFFFIFQYVLIDVPVEVSPLLAPSSFFDR